MNCSQTYTCSEPYLLPSSKFQTPLCSLNFSRASAAQVAAKQVTILIGDWSSCCPKGLQAKPHTHRNSWIAFLMVKMIGGIARGRVRTTTMTMTSRNMAAILQLISGPRHAALVYRVHLWYWTWAGGVARIFQRGVTLCQSESTHQIVMSTPMVFATCCGMFAQKSLTKAERRCVMRAPGHP